MAQNRCSPDVPSKDRPGLWQRAAHRRFPQGRVAFRDRRLPNWPRSNRLPELRIGKHLGGNGDQAPRPVIAPQSAMRNSVDGDPGIDHFPDFSGTACLHETVPALDLGSRSSLKKSQILVLAQQGWPGAPTIGPRFLHGLLRRSNCIARREPPPRSAAARRRRLSAHGHYLVGLSPDFAGRRVSCRSAFRRLC